MKKIILFLLGIFTLFSLTSCNSQCNCLGCQEYLITDMKAENGKVYDKKTDQFVYELVYEIKLKSGKTYNVDEKTYNSYKIGDIYEGEKD